MNKPRPPRRGELYWTLFEPARGVEQTGRRPSLVVQNDLGNEFAPYIVVAALTTATQRKPYPFVVPVLAGEGNLTDDSYIICAQLLTVDKSRLEQRIGALSRETMERVDAALRYELAL